MFAVYLLIAFAAGSALAIQAAVNTQLAKTLHSQPLMATLVSFAIGTLVLLAITLFKSDWMHFARNLAQPPLWKFAGGMLGALFVFTTILLAPKLGITNMLFFIIIGQLLTASVIDNFGLINMPVRPISGSKIAGLTVMAAGLAVFSFGDKISKWLH